MSLHKFNEIMGKGADKSQRDRRKATAPELARKAALRTKADDGKATTIFMTVLIPQKRLELSLYIPMSSIG